MEWISVKDRLPEKMVMVLIYDKYGFSIDRMVNKTPTGWPVFDGDEFQHNLDVTHWMPLPEPPKQ
jgi:hypothetical protein